MQMRNAIAMGKKCDAMNLDKKCDAMNLDKKCKCDAKTFAHYHPCTLLFDITLPRQRLTCCITLRLSCAGQLVWAVFGPLVFPTTVVDFMAGTMCWTWHDCLHLFSPKSEVNSTIEKQNEAQHCHNGQGKVIIFSSIDQVPPPHPPYLQFPSKKLRNHERLAQCCSSTTRVEPWLPRALGWAVWMEGSAWVERYVGRLRKRGGLSRKVEEEKALAEIRILWVFVRRWRMEAGRSF